MGWEREREGGMYWAEPDAGQHIRYGRDPIGFHVMKYCT